MNFEDFKDNLKNALIKSNISMSEDYVCFLEDKIQKENNSKVRFLLRKILKNSQIATKNKTPLCQDTGFITFYIYYPFEFIKIGEIKDICEESVKEVYSEMGFRFSMVDTEGKNTETNLPAYFHFYPGKQKNIKIDFLVKGGGSENVSGLICGLPSDSEEKIVERIYDFFIKNIGSKACPPYFIGIGKGGSSEVAVENSRKALLEYEFGQENDFENNIKKAINQSNVGIFGTGFGDTCLGVKVKRSAAHIATNVIAVAVNCHSFRRGTVTINI